jgi:uncharacterized membrane protein YccC
MSAPPIAPVRVITPPIARRRRANPIDSLLSLLVEELEPNPRRLKTTMRMALIGTVGAALMASCHVFNQLGTYLVWIMIGPVAMMSLRKALTCLAILAPVLIASMQLAGMLVEAPWLLLLFLFLFTTLTTYLNVALKLGAFGLIIQVVTIDTFYSVVFVPSDFGWHTAALYGCCVIAFGLITLFDNWLWPDPAELILPEAIAASVVRNRARFVAVANYYFAERGSKRPPEPAFTSGMPAQIALLDRTRDEGVSEHRRAILLAAISREERLHIQIDRMTIAVREDVPTQMRTIFRAEIEAAISAIAIALDELERDVLTSIRTGPDNPPSPAAVRARAALNAMDARLIELRPTYISRIGAAEAANAGAFTESLHEMVRLIERPLDTPPPALAATTPVTQAMAPVRTIDPALIRYSAKVGLCIVIGYIVGLTTQQPGLSTILTTVIITALPTYGATMRKMILRIMGGIVGGIITIIAIVISTPNFRTLPSYLIVTFVVLAVSAYSSLSSGRVAYAGKQIATTFLLVFAGLSPSADIYGPLWRIWGIFLGTVVVMIVFILVKPEYAGNSLLPRLRKVLRDALDLAPTDEAISSMAAINGLNTESMRVLSEILEVAEDARIEGRSSLIDHESVVQASGTLRRITNRFAGLATERITAPLPHLDEPTQRSRVAIYTALRARLESWLTFYDGANSLNRASAVALAAQHSRTDISQPLEEFGFLLGADGFLRISAWSLEQRRQILAELQSLSRLEFLMTELDTHLSHVPGVATGLASSPIQVPA